MNSFPIDAALQFRDDITVHPATKEWQKTDDAILAIFRPDILFVRFLEIFPIKPTATKKCLFDYFALKLIPRKVVLKTT